MKNFKFFQDKALLTHTLEVVEMVNEFTLSQILGEEKSYLSFDSFCISDEDVFIEADQLTTKLLNEIKCSGISNHKLVLKKRVPIMLLKNFQR